MEDSGGQNTGRRVPAEWETHAATYLQWPGQWETALRPSFTALIEVVASYETVHVLAASSRIRSEAEEMLAGAGISTSDLNFHTIRTDNAWMRDNGPVYVQEDGELVLIDFGFNAWGGHFGRDIPYENDDVVPQAIADDLGLRIEDYGSYILERGNLEVNGAGIAVLNWDCQDDRNPGLSRAEHEAILSEALGIERFIWAEGHDPDDGTTGHIDGYARFVNANTIAIGESEWGAETESALAAECVAAGLDVVRIAAPGDTDYMNWLVGNGFVAGMAFGGPNEEADANAEALLASIFPDRQIHMITANALWADGGGLHCITNDQPLH